MANIEFVRKLILKREGDDYFFNQGVMVFFTTEARGNFHHRGTESTVCFTTETRRHGVIIFTTEGTEEHGVFLFMKFLFLQIIFLVS